MLKAPLGGWLKTAQPPTRLCCLRAPGNMAPQGLCHQRTKCMQDASEYGAKPLLRAKSPGSPSGNLAPMATAP